MYMGRTVEYENWDPASESPENYLPHYNDSLTAIGFVGPHFSSYYPECQNVFGFWDTFADQKEVKGGFDITTNDPIQFRASYQAVGWLNDATVDPLADIVQTVTSDYNTYLKMCNAKGVSPELNPADFFGQIMEREMKWTYNQNDISYVLNSDKSIASLDLPTQTICSGIVQEVVWNMGSDATDTYFLAVPPTNNEIHAIWPTVGTLAMGNTVQEGLSAMLKMKIGQQTYSESVLTDYEYMLDALQLGLLNDLENVSNPLITMEEELHKNGFGSQDGGKLWQVVPASNFSNNGVPTGGEAVVSPDMAAALCGLNIAQKAYDMSRAQLIIKRKQLFMDWIRYVKLLTGETTDSNVVTNNLENFIDTSSSGELYDITNQETSTGLLEYSTDSSS